MEYHHITYRNVRSTALQRRVQLEIYMPSVRPWFWIRYPLLLMNDGQDLPKMQLLHTLEQFTGQEAGQPLVIVGVCAQERLAEYGTAGIPDYKGRGAKASQYSQFVVQELLPFLYNRFPLSKRRQNTVIAGFSLGGLSAFDIAWEHQHLFGGVGVFSGALWWRSQAFQKSDPDAHRIIHDKVRSKPLDHPTRYWFQAGTLDETSDRNNNGIIDAIDDTLHLMEALQENPKNEHATTHYEEVADGKHEVKTWAKVMPLFLEWMFGQ